MTTEELAMKVTETEERSKSNTKRLDRLEQTVEAIHELAKNVALLAKGQDDVKKDVDEIKKDVQALKAVPAKRWEQVIDKVIFGFVGAIVGALAAFIIKAL